MTQRLLLLLFLLSLLLVSLSDASPTPNALAGPAKTKPTGTGSGQGKSKPRTGEQREKLRLREQQRRTKQKQDMENLPKGIKEEEVAAQRSLWRERWRKATEKKKLLPESEQAKLKAKKREWDVAGYQNRKQRFNNLSPEEQSEQRKKHNEATKRSREKKAERQKAEANLSPEEKRAKALKAAEDAILNLPSRSSSPGAQRI